MERSSISKLTQQVVQKYPEMKSVKPTIREQAKPGGGKQFLLTFKGKSMLPGGKSLSRIVRVVADDHGRVIRMSTSK